MRYEECPNGDAVLVLVTLTCMEKFAARPGVSQFGSHFMVDPAEVSCVLSSSKLHWCNQTVSGTGSGTPASLIFGGDLLLSAFCFWDL